MFVVSDLIEDEFLEGIATCDVFIEEVRWGVFLDVVDVVEFVDFEATWGYDVGD